MISPERFRDIATRLGYESEHAMWSSLSERYYLSTLAILFGVSTSDIRSAMLRSGVQIKRWRVCSHKLSRQLHEISVADAIAFEKEGVPAAAKRLGVPYTTLRRHVTHMLRCAYDKKMETRNARDRG